MGVYRKMLISMLLVSCFLFSGNMIAEEKAMISVKSMTARAEKRTISDDQKIILKGQNGTVGERKAKIEIAVYECVLVNSLPEETKERTRKMLRYEVLVEGETNTNYRGIWTVTPAGEMRIFGYGPDENYLAWVMDGGICFEDISNPKSKKESLAEVFAINNKSERIYVPVVHLVGREPFLGLDALNYDIDILCVEKLKDESFRVKVRGGQTGEIFTFSFLNGEWVLVKSDGQEGVELNKELISDFVMKVPSFKWVDDPTIYGDVAEDILDKMRLSTSRSILSPRPLQGNQHYLISVNQ